MSVASRVLKHQFCNILILVAVIHCIFAKNLEGSIDQDSDAKLGSRDARIFGVRDFPGFS